jgi:hypothetical protein
MDYESFKSPTGFLKLMLGDLPDEVALRKYETWWEAEGKEISASVDREGTPWLKMFDVFGKRVDEILYPPAYWRMLKKGYRAGAIWRLFENGSLVHSYLLGYLTAFYDTGLYCPYTVSLSTAIPLSKYGDD